MLIIHREIIISSNEDMVWSDHSLTIREVVDKTIPTVVRVAEGFYGGNEAECTHIECCVHVEN
jgi:hypothetical protein